MDSQESPQDEEELCRTSLEPEEGQSFHEKALPLPEEGLRAGPADEKAQGGPHLLQRGSQLCQQPRGVNA